MLKSWKALNAEFQNLLDTVRPGGRDVNGVEIGFTYKNMERYASALEDVVTSFLARNNAFDSSVKGGAEAHPELE